MRMVAAAVAFLMVTGCSSFAPPKPATPTYLVFLRTEAAGRLPDWFRTSIRDELRAGGLNMVDAKPEVEPYWALYIEQIRMQGSQSPIGGGGVCIVDANFLGHGVPTKYVTHLHVPVSQDVLDAGREALARMCVRGAVPLILRERPRGN